jgi:cholesterol transport system auxiliary component
MAVSMAGCASSSSAIPTFELVAPRDFGKVRQSRRQINVTMPTALQALDTERVVVQPAASEVNYLGDAQWSDRLPRLMQARMIEALENGAGFRTARANDRLNADYQLATDVRAFGINIASAPQAVVEISARIVQERTGRIVASKVFTARTNANAATGAGAMAALNDAFGLVLVDLVQWTAKTI